MNKDFYLIEIFGLLYDIRYDENSCNEGSLTDDVFVKIICLLVQLYRSDK